LYDTSGVGLLLPPDGDSIAANAIRHLAGNVNPGQLRAALEAFAANVDLDHWRQDLENLLSNSGKPGLPSVPGASASKEDVLDYLDQLDSLRLMLADDQVQARLVLSQWQRAVESAIYPDPIRWSDIASTVTEFVQALNLRARQLLGSA